MSIRKPLMPECFLHWTEPPDANGDEVFWLATWRRNLTLKGKAFHEFEAEVLPLLTGKNGIDEICERVAHVFKREDVLASLDLLASQGIVVEGDEKFAQDTHMDLTTQRGWLSETAAEGMAAQTHLSDAHVVLFSAGAHGAACARSLVAAGVGQLTVVDASSVLPTDRYFSAHFGPQDLSRNRADVLVERLAEGNEHTKLTACTERPADADAAQALVEGATLVLCCLDSGELNLALTLNIACRSAGVPWIAASLEGSELVVGPGFAQTPDEPCYLCWRLREIAAAANPETRYAIEAQLDRLKTDLSGRRENIAASADIVGGMLSAEALTWITGVAPPNLTGRFLTVGVPGLRVEKHAVLKKPNCPVCSPVAAVQL